MHKVKIIYIFYTTNINCKQINDFSETNVFRIS